MLLRNVGSYKCHITLTSQKAAFFIVTAVKSSNLTVVCLFVCYVEFNVTYTKVVLYSAWSCCTENHFPILCSQINIFKCISCELPKRPFTLQLKLFLYFLFKILFSAINIEITCQYRSNYCLQEYHKLFYIMSKLLPRTSAHADVRKWVTA
jgi:hypothetical protein